MYHSIRFFGDMSYTPLEVVWKPYDEVTDQPITVGDQKILNVNTWDDWHLIPSSRPSIAHPEIETRYEDVAGKDGTQDVTEYLSHISGQNQTYNAIPGSSGAIYGTRTGSLEFYVDNDHEDWKTIRSKIIYALHGQKVKMELVDDDPGYYYIGRFNLNDWKSEAQFSKVVIDYTLEPYKRRLSNNNVVTNDI